MILLSIADSGYTSPRLTQLDSAVSGVRTVMYVVLGLVLVLMIVEVGIAITRRRSLSSILKPFLAVPLVALFGYVLSLVTQLAEDPSAKPAGPPTRSPVPAPAPRAQAPSHSTRTSVDVPWGTIGLIAAGVAAATVLVVIAVVLVRWVQARRRRAAALGRRLAALRGRHDTVVRVWGELETNLIEVFQVPLITDVTVPQTADFFSALDEADRRRDLLAAQELAGDDPDGALAGYETAVRELEDTWRVALAHARKIGHGFLPEVERKRVAKAIGLLRVACDQRAFPQERQACYLQALQLVRGLIAVPRQAAFVLERETRLALTGGSGTAPVSAHQPAATSAGKP